MRKLILVLPLISLLILTTNTYSQAIDCPNNTTNRINTNLPVGFNVLFAGSGECLLCHNSMTDAQGKPVGILNDWRSTMMSNAAKDPFWRAKVSHETLINPVHADVLEDICSRCHAPLGNFNAHHMGQTLYSIAEMETDPLALDGISCTTCHLIKIETFGTYSGNLIIDTNKTTYGPYENPFSNPMVNQTGYTPTFSSHITSSKLCGSCHTLITNSVDLEGNPTGESFVEQAIYHEWINSVYPENEQTCQTCHVPRIFDTVKVSSMPPWLDGRSPFGQHHMAGANVFMYKILKENIQSLGITAETQHFDSTISRTYYLLQESTLELDLTEINRTPDSLYLELSLKNLAGHKFPSGFPSRRAFVEIIAWNEMGDTLLHSGKMEDDFTLIGEDATYEEHHFAISRNEDVQIYEMVAGDVNGEVTTVLERAYLPLKDNRLPPTGFTSTHSSYDTVQIAGNALTDEDFNKLNGEEGTGKDILKIQIPTLGDDGDINIISKVYYQTTSPKWLKEMFDYSSPEIDLWKELYQNSNREPILIAEDLHTSTATSIDKMYQEAFIVYPNPSKDKVYIKVPETEQLASCDIYCLNGEKLKSIEFSKNSNEINLPGVKGIFIIKLTTCSNRQIIKKIVLN